MDKFQSWETQGLQEFFNCTEIADLVISVAKIVSKNLLNPQSISGKYVQSLKQPESPLSSRLIGKLFNSNLISEAIDVILLHSTSTQSILNRKSITKEHLFKYLHHKRVSVPSEFTKQLLIEKILLHWKQSFYLADFEDDDSQCSNSTTQKNQVDDRSSAKQTVLQQDPEQFPINQMARKFAHWFYEQLNTNRLQIEDFWSDCKCSVQFIENQQCLIEEQYVGADAVLEFCKSLLDKYSLYLNLNISHSGTQGRIDCHGLVLVLTCGTLHKVGQFVGTFEAVFGLSRDPFSQNNWKSNQITLRLHNFSAQSTQALDSSPNEHPTLLNSNTIAPLLSLSMGTDVDDIS